MMKILQSFLLIALLGLLGSARAQTDSNGEADKATAGKYKQIDQDLRKLGEALKGGAQAGKPGAADQCGVAYPMSSLLNSPIESEKLKRTFRLTREMYFLCRAVVSARASECDPLTPVIPPGSGNTTSERQECLFDSASHRLNLSLIKKSSTFEGDCRQVFMNDINKGAPLVPESGIAKACRDIRETYPNVSSLCARMQAEAPDFSLESCVANFSSANGDAKGCSFYKWPLEKTLCRARVVLAKAYQDSDKEACGTSGLCRASMTGDIGECDAYARDMSHAFCYSTAVSQVQHDLDSFKPKSDPELAGRREKIVELRRQAEQLEARIK